MAIMLKLSLDDFNFASKIATLIDDNASTAPYSVNKRAQTVGYKYRQAHHDDSKYIEIQTPDKPKVTTPADKTKPKATPPAYRQSKPKVSAAADRAQADQFKLMLQLTLKNLRKTWKI